MKYSNNKLKSRREFLGGCGKMASFAMLPSLVTMKTLNAAVTNNSNIDGYKALVCVFLAGGNDSFNMIAPYTWNMHQNYVKARPTVAIPRNNLNPVPTNSDENMPHLGFHPSMSSMENLYRAGDLAIVANIGTLVRPTTMSDYRAEKALPTGLFSHREQQLSWQTSVADKTSANGWIGRMSELMNDVDTSGTDTSLTFSLKGSPRILKGNYSSGFTINAGHGANALDLYNDTKARDAYDATLNSQYVNVLKKQYVHDFKDIVDKAEFYNNVLNGSDNAFDGDAFPNTDLGQQLKQVALTIAARDNLGTKRQSFVLSQGSYDHHTGLLENQESLLKELNDALLAFNNAMKAINMHDNVTTYTASDFGRTIASNGSGTDHGWGGNSIVMGGAVKGDKTYGKYPLDLREGRSPEIDTGRGRFIPTTSVDQLHADLAYWYGVGKSDIGLIVPNKANYSNLTVGLFDH